MPSIAENVVNNDLCIGCGVCAGICPQQLLVMNFNIHGEYNPFLKQPCSTECGLCMRVCPFNEGNMNETEIGRKLFEKIEGIKYSEETGYYLDSFVGYSPTFRETSASGGMATWLLAKLLEKSVVDYVICVATQDTPEKLFSFQIFEEAESIARSSGSAYYPVELSDMIKTILDKPGRYAITGLPCFIKAIRLATTQNQKLKERITVLIGLVCGQMKSKHYTTYLSELANAGGKLQRVNYRGKSPDKPASNYYFHCINQYGTEGKVFWNDGVSEAFVNRWFTPNACNYCDDVFAELADVSFMDAWLPEYSNDNSGTSLMLVRSHAILNLVHQAIDNDEINVNNIPVDKVIQSQAGVLNVKRKLLSYHLHLASKMNLIAPNKRVNPNKRIGFLNQKEVELKLKMQENSKHFFITRNQTMNIKNVRTIMHPYLKQTKNLRLIKRLTFPIRIVKKYVSIRR
ncbi:Coenzyme F420 hydrogenase/dehydrogenase, beta subunit C-terminal domain [Methanolobus halotolerans]|uniref:4Fe-4S ferredoxin n=1 Tax=Methanolobus halotolerans TaxID=2052935 RepID=A0A4E0PTU0_9EURY|nr:Coenzyme F420 hydrogenase/dehydrogenase, beta subunit C-terminal domain [Methanolobus halotolerans]TGC08029.1 4Fe-4S ferredoxin [Methanolobus halotolerans]